jgi:ABC-type branched-subunit amino acid transport system substrate-binding protein
MPSQKLSENDEDLPPIATRTRERRRKLRALATMICVVLVAGGLTGWHFWPSAHAKAAPPAPCPGCVTDGAPAFEPGSQPMRRVQTAIAHENARVTGDGKPYVTVALLNPFTATPDGDVSLPRMVDQLWGAYLAQTSMNASGVLGVQLILANEGTSAEPTAVLAARQLETMEGAPDHLVAVTGLGLSITATETAAETLARNDMPMFGAVISADQFSSSLFKNMNLTDPGVLIQVVPDVGAQVDKLATVIGKPAKAVVVFDQQATDLYTSDLKADFSRVFSASLGGRQPSPYTPGGDDDAEFKYIASSVCYTQGSPPDVLYAGRASVLASLVQKLQDDINCAGKKITVITAGDGDGLAPSATKSAAGQGQVSLIYSDIVNLAELTKLFKASYASTLATVDPTAAGLQSTWMVATYDSMMAAWTAIQAAHSAHPPTLPGRGDVAQLAELLTGENAVPGATGTLSLTPDGQPAAPEIPVFEDSAGNRSAY